MIINKQDWGKYVDKPILLEIYSKDNLDSFALGYMVANLEQYYIFKTIDEYGYIDGYTAYKKSYIKNIKCKTSYTNIYCDYIKLLKKRNVFDNLNLEKMYCKIPNATINDILKFCYSNGLFLVIRQVDNEYYEKGKIVSLTSQNLVLDEEAYYKDFGIEKDIINDEINIYNLLTIDIITKETYLYQEHLKLK